jgi:hypothetical protein
MPAAIAHLDVRRAFTHNFDTMKAGVFLLGLAVVLAGIAAFPLLMHRSVQSRIGPEHVFTLSEIPGALTEEFVVAKARETLSLDGLNSSLWLLATNGCTISANRAVLMFCTRSPAATPGTRFVRVGLDSNRVVCQVSVGK